MKIAIIGVSHLGACLGIAAHRQGNDVLWFDPDRQRFAEFSDGKFETGEPGVTEFLESHHPGFTVSNQSKQLLDADLILVGLDTVFDSSGNHDESGVRALVEFVGGVVPSQTPVLVASQVRPGFMGSVKTCHPSLYYMVESLVFGDGIARALKPERHIIGASDPKQDLPFPLQTYLGRTSEIHVMNYESAEFCKLAVNFLLGSSISAANSLASLAEKIGVNWISVEPALRQDKRIGRYAYISPGTGIGGANIMRDVTGIQELSRAHGVDNVFASGIRRSSASMKGWASRAALRVMRAKKSQNILILGAIYKVGTISTEGGVATEIANSLGGLAHVAVYEKYIRENQALQTIEHLRVRNIRALNPTPDILVVGTPGADYAEEIEALISLNPGAVVIDPFRTVDRSNFGASTQLIQLGVRDA